MLINLQIEILLNIFDTIDDDTSKILKSVCKYFNNTIKYLQKIKLIKLKLLIEEQNVTNIINKLLTLELYPYNKNLDTLSNIQINCIYTYNIL